MARTTLVDARTLAAKLGRPDWVVVDCRFELAAPAAGRAAYRAGHIPGAVYAHLDEDLSGPKTPGSGRHPLPDPARLAETFGAWGIGPDTQVVAYDDRTGAMAARLWWLLRWLGHDEVAVLDGGLAAWRESGGELSQDAPAPRPVRFDAHPRPGLLADAEEILAGLSAPRLRLIDARAAARYRGELEPIDPVAGHIPGAVSHPLERNLDEHGRFLPPAILRERLSAALGEHPPAEAVSYCGSGVTACHNLLALEIAGLKGARLYAGSWSEWIRDPSRPVARGP